MTCTVFNRRKNNLADCGAQVVGYLENKYGECFTVIGARGESWGLPADRFWVKRTGDGDEGVFAVYGRNADGVCAFADAYYSVLIRPAYEKLIRTWTDAVLPQAVVWLTLNRESPNPGGLTQTVPLSDIHRYIRPGGPQFTAKVTLTAPEAAFNHDNPAALLLRLAERFAKAKLMVWLTLYVTDDNAMPPVVCYTGTDYVARVLTHQTPAPEAVPVFSPADAPITGVLLHDFQLERLCALVYLDGLLLQRDGGTLGEIVDYLLAYGLEDGKADGRLPCEMTEAEWRRVLRAVRLDTQLCALRMVKTVDVTEAERGGGAPPGHRAIGFIDGEGNAYAVFRGTCGDDEWYDNALGMVQTDTVQQQAAAAFVTSLSTMDGVKKIVTAGHSKGGNKAQYVAAVSPEGQVCYCFSLDGQGFSPLFMEKYRDNIENRKSFIHRAAERRDFVNCLGVSLPGEAVFRTGRRGDIRPDAPHGEPLPYFHCPDALRDASGRLGAVADTTPIPEALNRLVVYFLQEPRYEKDREATAVDLISLLMKNKNATTEETAEALVNLIVVFMDLVCSDPGYREVVEAVIFNETDVLLASFDAAVKPRETANREKDKSLLTCVTERLALRILKDKQARGFILGGLRHLIPLLVKMRGLHEHAGTDFTELITQLETLSFSDTEHTPRLNGVT